MPADPPSPDTRGPSALPSPIRPSGGCTQMRSPLEYLSPVHAFFRFAEKVDFRRI
ncbi:hypothetical protein GCM10018793_39930 [Streptomyces sulfonofaciens]|uniref:Uncharacterized protein n=1 Tax=Streptomyces sulfonofaciens TaxID=68272 RepID=A0A919GC54_9ACTN|nr:hypothetical protein GCM10018793_39930 [Streptomyces sulfonofaciens]